MVFDTLEITTLFLRDKEVRHEWRQLLERHDIASVTDDDVLSLDYTFGIYDDENLIATISTSSNVLKYLVIDENHRHDGKLFNLLVSHVINTMASQGYYHLLVFTKITYAKSFEYLGFSKVMSTDYGVFLEKGDQTITTYLSQLPKIEGEGHKSAIVMNANPFTKGHLYLIEEALKKSDGVYVFVVSTDKSLFTSQERFEIVRAGVAHLNRVVVCPGGDYMVSLATFPSYFIKNKDEVITYQTQLDALIFKEYIAKALDITTRFLGEEPLSKTTDAYNQALRKYLPPEVDVKIIPRKKIGNQVISATKVRECIQLGNLKSIKDIVPTTTYQFIKEHLHLLQKRLANN